MYEHDLDLIQYEFLKAPGDEEIEYGDTTEDEDVGEDIDEDEEEDDEF